MEISNLFTSHYYFDIYPKASALSIFVAIYFVAILALRPYLRILAGRHLEGKNLRKLQKKHLRKLAVIGILGIISVGARHLAIPLLGMRVLAYILVLWSLYEIRMVVRVHKKTVYEVAKTKKTLSETDKYIPRPKKKRRRK